MTQYGFVELDTTATRERFGSSSLSSSSRFPSLPADCEESPVTLPPGWWARLATRPAPTGSPADIMIGMELVALSAARGAGVPQDRFFVGPPARPDAVCAQRWRVFA